MADDDYPVLEPEKPQDDYPVLEPEKSHEDDYPVLEPVQQETSPVDSTLKHALSAVTETAKAGWEAAKKPFIPPTKEEAAKYLGPAGAWRSFTETGEALLSPLTMTAGVVTAAPQSLIASGLAAITPGPKTPEEKYQEWYGNVGTAMFALGPSKGRVGAALAKQGGTAGSEAAAGTTQGPKPTADVPVTEAENAAVRAPTPGPENYGKAAAPTEGAAVNVSDVDPTIRAAAEAKIAPPELEAKIPPALQGENLPPGLAAMRQRIEQLQERPGVPAGETQQVPATMPAEGLQPTGGGQPMPPPAVGAPPAPPPAPPRLPPPTGPLPTPPAGPPSPAVQSILNRISSGPQRAWWGISDYYRGLVDQLNPLKRFESEMAAGRQLAPGESPYVAARLAQGGAPAAADQMLKTGIHDPTTGQQLAPGLLESLKSIDSPQGKANLDAYLAARRVIELEGRGVKTGFNLADANQTVAQLGKDYGPFARLVDQFQDAGLTLLERSGIIDAKQKLQMQQANRDYVPFFREMDYETGGVSGNVAASKPLSKIKGSDRLVKNPLESVIENHFRIVKAAQSNEVGLRLKNLAAQTPASPAGPMMQRVRKLPGQELNPDEIQLFDKGKREVYKLSDVPTARAIKGMDTETLGTVGWILGAPARWLRLGATLAPEFILRNPIRDQLVALATSKYGYVPFWDLAKGFAQIVGDTQTYRDWRLSGGANSALMGVDRNYLGENARRLVAQTTAQKSMNVLTTPIEWLRKLAEISENSTRVGAYMRGLKAGATPQEAAFASRDILDYARAGTISKGVNSIVPFFNAQIQGVDAAARAFKANPASFMAKMGVGITTPSVLLWAANHNDPRYRELPAWDRDFFWHIMTDNWRNVDAKDAANLPKGYTRQLPNGQWQYNNGTIYRIPKPFELGVLFGSIPERILDWYADNHPDAFKKLGGSLASALTPGIMPQAITPALEQAANYSFFRQAPLIPKAQEKLQPQEQYTPTTSEVAKGVGRALTTLSAKAGNIIPGESTTSPIIIDNYIRQWSGGLGNLVVQGIDKALKATGAVPSKVEPTATLADYPGIRGFVSRFPSSSARSIQDFYETYGEREKAQATAKMLSKKGDVEGAQAIRENQAFVKAEPIHKALGNLFKVVRGIDADPKMSPDQKRDMMDRTYLQMIGIAQRGNDIFRQTAR